MKAEERQLIRSQIAMSLCNIGTLNLFWSPTTRRVYARSTSRSIAQCFFPGVGRPALPTDAVHVGLYEYGIPVALVMDDLDDVIANPPSPILRPPQPCETTVAAPKDIPATEWKWTRLSFRYGPRST